MGHIWFLFAVPILAYLGLAALPFGRRALIGCIATGVLAGAVAVFAGELPYVQAMALMVTAAAGLAGMVQCLRVIIGRGGPVWAYPALVAAGIGLVIYLVFGVGF